MTSTDARNVKMLGKGGFRAVYQAVDTRFQGQRLVAIKEMSDAQPSQNEKAKGWRLRCLRR
jgi:serine/threonine protein kinase